MWCPERSATSAYHRVCHADKSVRLDFMADTTLYLNHLTSTKQPYWQARIGGNLEGVNSETVKK